MENYSQNIPRAQLYVNEKMEWQKKILSQTNELPGLEDVLQQMLTIENPADKELNQHDLVLLDQLNKQKLRMKELSIALDEQQQRLENDSLQNPLYDLQVLCAQDILRESIKEAEKTYTDLKCCLLKYIPAVL